MILSLYWSYETVIRHFSRTVAWCWIPESRVKNVTLSRVMYSVSSVTEGGRVRVKRVTASNNLMTKRITKVRLGPNGL